MITLVGSIALDSIETPFEKEADVLGGSATFISASASKLAPCAVVGIVGSDFPQKYLDLFKKWKVDTSGLEVAEGPTFRWACRYHDDMIHRDTLSTELGVFETFSPKVPQALRDSEYVALGNIHPEQQMQALDQMASPKWVVADTMKLWIDIARPSLERLLKRIDCFVINDEEARQLTGKVSLTAAAKELIEQGPSTVIIKRGEHGASLHTSEDSLFYAPAYPLDTVKDTTGAGDTFLGGLIGWVARQERHDFETIKQGILVGSCLASFTVESSGATRLDAANWPEMVERISALRNLTRTEGFVLL